jgi:predicted transcriptional regulator of viral defense system
MNPKTNITKIKLLKEKSSFTSKDAKKFGISSALLSYYVKKGELERIGHGIYRGENAPTTNEFRWEDIIFATKRVKNGVVCLSSALAIYNLTEEIPRQHWIAISNSTRHRSDSSIKIVRMRNTTLGRTKINIGGISVPIFNIERTLVDSFRFLSLETAFKALKTASKNKRKINWKKIKLYAKKLRVNIDAYILVSNI